MTHRRGFATGLMVALALDAAAAPGARAQHGPPQHASSQHEAVGHAGKTLGGASVHASYETYAGGLKVADVAAGFSLGAWSYQMQLAYRTTGLVGFFYRGHQRDEASGTWKGEAALPSGFLGLGLWSGRQREVKLVYQQGSPTVQTLVPPNDGEREEVPNALRNNTIDTVSALAQLIHVVATTGRCDTVARTYDGRREVEITAHTVGEEQLAPTDRSSFSGTALRCDFSGRLVAGFKYDDDRAKAGRPMHGSAWLAPVAAAEVMLPVRLSFETRWFGDATMYLTDVGRGPAATLAWGN